MRIGIDARFYSSAFTGIGRYVYELIDHLLKIDTKNEYVIFLNAPHFEEFKIPRDGVEKVLVEAPYYSLAEQTSFVRALYKARLSLMHFTHFNAPIAYRRPCVVTIHDLTLSFYPGKKMNSALHRIAYNTVLSSIVQRAAHVIAVSAHTKKDLTRMLRVPQEKISVVYEGISSHFAPIADRSLIDAFKQKSALEKPYLLYTGVWRAHKNLVNLIKAFGILRREQGFEGSLMITGKEDPWYPEVKQTVEEESLGEAVRFMGLVSEEELVLLYNGALMYVFPSLYEGFGLPALEAFACGTPVCAARSSSLPEICGEGNAVFFDPHDPADIAEKIASVYTDPEKIALLRARGFARCKDFSWEEMARKTLTIYTHVHSAQHARA